MALEGIQDVALKVATPEIQSSGASRHAAAEALASQTERLATEQEQPISDVSRETLQEAIDQLNHAVSILNHRLNFSIDGDTGRLMAKVIDTKTNEVIRQVPPERVLAFVRRFQEFMGLFLDEKA